MTLDEWGSLTPAAVAPLYRREQQQWLKALSWDTSASWVTIETARVGWGLPGFVCRDGSGNVRGWTYFMKRDGALEVGGIVADTEAATYAVIDGLAAEGSPLGGFVYATAPGLANGLAKHDVHTERYAYLMRSTSANGHDHLRTSAPSQPRTTLRPWNLDDVARTAGLLQSAYGSAGYLFARDNRRDEWHSYVQSLVAHSGCGVLLPHLSTVVECDGVTGGVALVTALSPDTAHLAQLAIAPSFSRGGLGRRLIAELMASARQSGYCRLSLLVSRENAPACALYRAFGFELSGEFLALRETAE